MKILLIDDEESIVNILTISLKSDGYEVVSAYNGRDGIEKYRKESPDIVITDLKMPGVSGLEVLKKIREINPDAEIIIITGHGDMDSAIEALEYGASDFINKPIKDSALAIALSRAKEKLAIKKTLKDYTRGLEDKVEETTQEIRRKSSFQTKLISSSYNGIVATDENGIIVIYNPVAESIFGYERSRVLDKMKYSELYPQDVTLVFKDGLDNKKTVRNTTWADTEITAESGEKVPVRYSGTLLYEKGIVMGSVVFFQDRREIRRLEEELIKSERLAAIGQTVAGLAHYIKNILTGLKGGSYIVNSGLKGNNTKKIDEGWEMVQKNINRVSDLVLDLLSFSKKREVELQNCSPNKVIEEVCDLMGIRASENDIELTTDLDPLIGEVLVDEQIIHHAVLNLITNAIDACIFDMRRNKNFKVKVNTKLDDGGIIFEVSDNGSGMPEEVKNKIFTSFYSTKKGKGTGLGLLTTKKLVEEHGGSIIFTSREGEGAVFTIRLPLKKDKKRDGVPAPQTLN